MIKDYTTGKSKFVQIKVQAPDGRFNQQTLKGGIDKKTALFESKKYPQEIIIMLFDSAD